jgi:hypothetical protein
MTPTNHSDSLSEICEFIAHQVAHKIGIYIFIYRILMQNNEFYFLYYIISCYFLFLFFSLPSSSPFYLFIFLGDVLLDRFNKAKEQLRESNELLTTMRLSIPNGQVVLTNRNISQWKTSHKRAILHDKNKGNVCLRWLLFFDSNNY